MFRRSIAIVMALAAMAAGLVAGATPAYADTYNPFCWMYSYQPHEIACRETSPVDRKLTSIDWFVNGSSVAQYKNSPIILIACSLGQQRFTVSYNLTFATGAPATGTAQPYCTGQGPTRIADF